MSVEQLLTHEALIKEKNAWCIAEDICARIDNEPGPGGSFMKAYVTDSKGVCQSIEIITSCFGK